MDTEAATVADEEADMAEAKGAAREETGVRYCLFETILFFIRFKCILVNH